MTEKTPAPLKIGLIVDSRFGSSYVNEFITWVRAEHHLSLDVLVVENLSTRAPTSISRSGRFANMRRPGAALQAGLLWAITVLEGVVLRSYPAHGEHSKKFDLARDVPCILHTTSGYCEDNPVYQYSEEDVRRIEAEHLDLLVKYSPGKLYGDVVNAAGYGIIALQYQDERTNRSGPPGFWEVHARQATTGFAIQRLTREPGAGRILMRGHAWTQFFYLLNQAFLLKKANYHLMKTVLKLSQTRIWHAKEEKQPYDSRKLTRPSLSAQLAYISKTALLFGSKAAKRRFGRKYRHWGVAFCRREWGAVELCLGQRIENPRHCYLADPFVVRHGNRDICFVEEYDRKRAKGHIAAYEIKQHLPERLGLAIDEPFHMSFPYLFKVEDDLYMCPETSGNNDIRVYKCVDFPLEWELAAVLMSNVVAADSMILQMEGLWWMFTNISDPPELRDFSAQLCIFYSDRPLSSAWYPHSGNPVVLDARKGRNAGLLIDEGSLYRVSQRQGFDTYGEGFAINEIRILDTEQYVEREVCCVRPNFFPRLERTHHMHSNNSVTVFDFGMGPGFRFLG